MMNEEDKMKRIKELTNTLNSASKVYYVQDDEMMSDFEYDRLYDELVSLEKETGITLANSPTQHVGYESVDSLPKERHPAPMLSLGKTKSREELRSWLGDNEGLLSWKLDGLTVVLTYNDGKLAKAVTRGNGEIGEVITNNARTFINIPGTISYKGELILRGEAVISYKDFEKINETIPEAEGRYKNPRNLCSGSVRQLNNSITAQRRVRLIPFALVKADGIDFHNSREEQYRFLTGLGFDVVPYKRVTKDNIADAISYYEKAIETFEIPSDGLVLLLDDISYGESLGMTAKFPRNAIAFKWADERAETVLRRIEWSQSRTGLINPVAVFDPVELEGTTVTRASVHNVSIMENMKLGIGDSITVYKANMIIPQIADNLSGSGTEVPPDTCPACGAKTEIRQINEGRFLYCANPECPAKKIKSFTLFTSRDAMNIEGLSEAGLEKFIGQGFIHEFADIYHLKDKHDDIVSIDGYGEKSFEKMCDNIERSRDTTASKVIYGLGIANIGLSTARLICSHFGDDIGKMKTASEEELDGIDGVGPVIGKAFCDYFRDDSNVRKLDHILAEVRIIKNDSDEESKDDLSGKVFVITGSLEHFASRSDLKDILVERGAKVTGSVTSKTTCLINNDIESSSNKNQTAKELGVPIIDEESFLKEYLPGNI